MFARRPEPAPETPTEAPSPVRQKVEAHKSKIFTQGHTFAERKAQADANRAILAQRRLASLGPTEFAQRDRRNGEVTYIPAELFCDVDNPNKRFVSIDGVPGLIELNAGNAQTEVARPIGTMSRRHGPSGLYPEAMPDRSPRPV